MAWIHQLALRSTSAAAAGLILGMLMLPLDDARGQPVELLRIRAANWEDRVRVVLDLSAQTTYRERALRGPHRIAIDLSQTTAPSLRPPQVDDWMVTRIRFNQLRGPTAQVVLDLSREPSFDVFMLPAYENKPFRVVCDVFRPLRGEPGRKKAKDTWIVIIDPGHGGRDPGVVTRRARLKEKDVVLDVALRLKRVLDPEAGVEVRLTRDQDMFLGLRDRVVRSEALGGDLFLSIHVNGCRQQAARGAEVFFLSLRGATSAAARELEALENSVDATQDPMLGEMAELPFAVDLLQTDTILRSSFLAETILDALDQSGLAATRGVKQANFAVLRSCRLPSALIELGFMSNPEDARKLGSASHRQALAETIAIGLLEFQRRYARHTEAPSERTSKASP